MKALLHSLKIVNIWFEALRNSRKDFRSFHFVVKGLLKTMAFINNPCCIFLYGIIGFQGPHVSSAVLMLLQLFYPEFSMLTLHKTHGHYVQSLCIDCKVLSVTGNMGNFPMRDTHFFYQNLASSRWCRKWNTVLAQDHNAIFKIPFPTQEISFCPLKFGNQPPWHSRWRDSRLIHEISLFLGHLKRFEAYLDQIWSVAYSASTQDVA